MFPRSTNSSYEMFSGGKLLLRLTQCVTSSHVTHIKELNLKWNTVFSRSTNSRRNIFSRGTPLLRETWWVMSSHVIHIKESNLQCSLVPRTLVMRCFRGEHSFWDWPDESCLVMSHISKSQIYNVPSVHKHQLWDVFEGDTPFETDPMSRV